MYVCFLNVLMTYIIYRSVTVVFANTVSPVLNPDLSLANAINCVANEEL
jgi:hypothetical protein